MAKHLKNDGLVEAFQPAFAVECRRTTPGVPFMDALNEDHVPVHFTPVEDFIEEGVVATDGTSVHVIDTIVFATSFDTTYIPHFEVVGWNAATIRSKFTPNPNSYLGCVFPGRIT